MKKPKKNEALIVLVIATVIFSSLFLFINDQKDNKLQAVTTTISAQAEKTSQDIMPKKVDLPLWFLTESQNINIDSTGLVDGTKARFTRADPPATIVVRIEIYSFEDTEYAEDFYNSAVNKAKQSGYNEIDLSYDIECYADSFYENDLSRYNMHCHDKNIYFSINVIGNKAQDSSKYASEFFEAIIEKL